MSDYASLFNLVDDLATSPVTNYLVDGATESILYEDPSGRTYVRMLTMPPGIVTGEKPLLHDFDEVVYVLEGLWVDHTRGIEHPAGTVAVFPAGTEHGPFSAPQGCRFIEFRHFPRDAA